MIGTKKEEEILKIPSDYLAERNLYLSTTIGRVLGTENEINECRYLSKNGHKIKVPQIFCNECMKTNCHAKQIESL